MNFDAFKLLLLGISRYTFPGIVDGSMSLVLGLIRLMKGVNVQHAPLSVAVWYALKNLWDILVPHSKKSNIAYDRLELQYSLYSV